MNETATGRPKDNIPLWARALAPLLCTIAVLEGTTQLLMRAEGSPFKHALTVATAPALRRYLPFRAWVLKHPLVAGLAGLALAVTLLAGVRWALLIWHNQVVARLSGTRFLAEEGGFPMKRFKLLDYIERRPPGALFVGLSPEPGVFRRRWRPVYVSARQRTMHRHCLGRLGSGKTSSVLWPQVLQDALDGKGVVVMDGKGSDENVRTMKGIAKQAGRMSELKVFCLPAWNQPRLFSHTYNLVYVRPRGTKGPRDPGGDPVATAERVFASLSLGDNAYYNVQAELLLKNMLKALHGMVDASGKGLPFVLRDVTVALKGVGDTSGWGRALKKVLKESTERAAAREVENQVRRLGDDAQKCFSGLIGALDKLDAPIVNAYAPDIVFEEVLEKGQLVYVQLPANLFKLQAPAIGKAMLMDVQQEGSLRQVFREGRSQAPFAVVVDEFYDFADTTIVSSLNKLRDAHLEYTLAHQSIADLERISKEFAEAVWDNTRTKDVLNQDNPKLCEMLAHSIGTHQVVERTVRQQQGALFTSLMTGDASSKLVEAYRLHPNRIKSLARAGQGYLLNDEGIHPVCYAPLPAEVEADYPLKARDQRKAVGLKLYEEFIEPLEPSASCA
jgi:hypothetical protein